MASQGSRGWPTPPPPCPQPARCSSGTPVRARHKPLMQTGTTPWQRRAQDRAPASSAAPSASTRERRERRETGDGGAQPGVAHAAEMRPGVGWAGGHGARAAGAGMLAAPRLTRSPGVTWCARGAVVNHGGSAHHHGGKPALLAPIGMVYSVFPLTRGSFVDFFNFFSWHSMDLLLL